MGDRPNAIEQLVKHDPTCPRCGTVEGDCAEHGAITRWFVTCHLCKKVKSADDEWRALYELAFHYDRRHRGWTDPKPCPFQIRYVETGEGFKTFEYVGCAGVEGHDGAHQSSEEGVWTRSKDGA